MDFAFSDEQQAIKDLAKQILKDKITEESLRELEESESYFHERAWKDLVQSQLVGIALPEDVGGGGMGEFELSLILQQIGRFVAPVPVLPSIVMAAMPICEFGSDEQKSSVREMLKGGTPLTAAFYEPGGTSLKNPLTTAVGSGDTVVINGTKTNVALPGVAKQALVNVRLEGGEPALFLVPLDADGIEISLQRQTNFETTAYIEFNGVEVPMSSRIGASANPSDVFAYVEQRILFAQAAIMLGVAEQALQLTAEFATTREQFGKPIGMFQAVSQRAGDAFIDVASMRLMVWKAAYDLAEGHDAGRSTRVAAYWAAEGGHRVVAAAQHLHGGMGFDCDYPLHRYFLTMKTLEFALGGARAQLDSFGNELAAQTAS